MTTPRDDRPREWGMRLAAGPVPVGDVLRLVLAAVVRRVEERSRKRARRTKPKEYHHEPD
jgi:hypothetical protein